MKLEENAAIPCDYWRTVFDVTPVPTFIVDENIQIIEANPAAEKLLAEEREEILRHKGGEVLRCIHAVKAGNRCGISGECKNCVIRNSVQSAARGTGTRRTKARMERLQDGKRVEAQIWVTTTPFVHQSRNHVLLILEDITELLSLRKLLPVCAHCKRIRDDEKYWQDIDTYLAEHMDMNFSHGVCPDCFKQYYSESLGTTESPGF